MATKLKMVDVTKLKKSNIIVSEHAEDVLSQAKSMIDKQEEFMNQVGMDRQKLRAFINSDAWSPKQRQKAREELVRFHGDFKNDINHEASLKSKEIKLSSKLLKPTTKQVAKGSKRRRTNFL